MFNAVLCFSQKQAKNTKRERPWVYDVNIIRDPSGQMMRVEKKVFCKGTQGGNVQVRYFETTEKRGPDGRLVYSTTERVGENNVSPEIIKQYGDTSRPSQGN